MQGIDGHIWGWGEGGGQVHLGRVRLGEHRGLVAGVGGGEAGVVHGAAHGMDGGAVIVHIGVLCHLADDQRVKLAHFCFSFRISSSVSTKDWNSGLQRWKRCCPIKVL